MQLDFEPQLKAREDINISIRSLLINFLKTFLSIQIIIIFFKLITDK